MKMSVLKPKTGSINSGTGDFGTSCKFILNVFNDACMITFSMRFLFSAMTPAVNLPLVSLTPVVKNDIKIGLQPKKSFCLNVFVFNTIFSRSLCPSTVLQIRICISKYSSLIDSLNQDLQLSFRIFYLNLNPKMKKKNAKMSTTEYNWEKWVTKN